MATTMGGLLRELEIQEAREIALREYEARKQGKCVKCQTQFNDDYFKKRRLQDVYRDMNGKWWCEYCKEWRDYPKHRPAKRR